MIGVKRLVAVMAGSFIQIRRRLIFFFFAQRVFTALVFFTTRRDALARLFVNPVVLALRARFGPGSHS